MLTEIVEQKQFELMQIQKLVSLKDFWFKLLKSSSAMDTLVASANSESVRSPDQDRRLEELCEGCSVALGWLSSGCAEELRGAAHIQSSQHHSLLPELLQSVQQLLDEARGHEEVRAENTMLRQLLHTKSADFSMLQSQREAAQRTTECVDMEIEDCRGRAQEAARVAADLRARNVHLESVCRNLEAEGEALRERARWYQEQYLGVKESLLLLQRDYVSSIPDNSAGGRMLAEAESVANDICREYLFAGEVGGEKQQQMRGTAAALGADMSPTHAGLDAVSPIGHGRHAASPIAGHSSAAGTPSFLRSAGRSQRSSPSSLMRIGASASHENLLFSPPADTVQTPRDGMNSIVPPDSTDRRSVPAADATVRFDLTNSSASAIESPLPRALQKTHYQYVCHSHSATPSTAVKKHSPEFHTVEAGRSGVKMASSLDETQPLYSEICPPPPPPQTGERSRGAGRRQPAVTASGSPSIKRKIVFVSTPGPISTHRQGHSAHQDVPIPDYKTRGASTPGRASLGKPELPQHLYGDGSWAQYGTNGGSTRPPFR